MVEALGATELKLVRVQIGPLRIGALPVGKGRLLSDVEIRALKEVSATEHRLRTGRGLSICLASPDLRRE